MILHVWNITHLVLSISNNELNCVLKLHSLGLDPAEEGMSRSTDVPSTLTSLMAKLT